MSHVHVIPVDPSLTPDEAWKEICIFGKRVTSTGSEGWVNMTCEGEECGGIETARIDGYRSSDDA